MLMIQLTDISFKELDFLFDTMKYILNNSQLELRITRLMK